MNFVKFEAINNKKDDQTLIQWAKKNLICAAK